MTCSETIQASKEITDRVSSTSEYCTRLSDFFLVFGTVIVLELVDGLIVSYVAAGIVSVGALCGLLDSFKSIKPSISVSNCICGTFGLRFLKK